MAITQAHRHRLRIGRHSQSGQIYLITTVTRGRRPVFSSLDLGRCVVNTLIQAEKSAHTLAYVVMPDHLHWLMQLNSGHQLPDVIHFVKSTSARRINRKLNTAGSVWDKGYHDRVLRKNEDLLDCARYIVGNPLRAGIVQRASDYPLWDTVWV